MHHRDGRGITKLSSPGFVVCAYKDTQEVDKCILQRELVREGNSGDYSSLVMVVIQRTCQHREGGHSCKS